MCGRGRRTKGFAGWGLRSCCARSTFAACASPSQEHMKACNHGIWQGRAEQERKADRRSLSRQVRNQTLDPRPHLVSRPS
eukprot:1184643-Rhodomonas_salina.2